MFIRLEDGSHFPMQHQTQQRWLKFRKTTDFPLLTSLKGTYTF